MSVIHFRCGFCRHSSTFVVVFCIYVSRVDRGRNYMKPSLSYIGIEVCPALAFCTKLIPTVGAGRIPVISRNRKRRSPRLLDQCEHYGLNERLRTCMFLNMSHGQCVCSFRCCTFF